MFKGEALPGDRITLEMFELVAQMVDDPDESWWGKIGAMKALARANPKTIAKHVDSNNLSISRKSVYARQCIAFVLKDMPGGEKFHQYQTEDDADGHQVTPPDFPSRLNRR